MVSQPYITSVAENHIGDHVYVTPILRACWNEDLASLTPDEDQGQTVPTSERTELKVQ